MTRELLELAARAAGYVVKGETVDSSDQFTHLLVNSGHGTRKFRWNPRDDDGDCARMEATINIDVDWHRFGVYATAGDMATHEAFADHNGDKAKARRWASVRAAAEMGRGCEPGERWK